MGNRLNGNNTVRLGLLPLVITFDVGVVTHREIRRFHICPCQIFIAIFSITVSFTFTVAYPLTACATTIGSIVTNLGKTIDIPTLKHDRQPKSRTYTTDPD
uniref:Uncharacterized protein n=1 Tax=Candidatus Kentrum sp. LFY TaxID=2126342 RepID=A0A450U6N6_9GAMM|nr:MAG: hypothetical protein BECKLFY1418B_GA0070995_100620 [Candidatus Kentron sp. LFY]